jgi:hypothetical protein
MPKVAVKLMAFHAFPSEREIPLFVKDLTITCETWAEVDLMVAEMVAYPILVAGSALFPDGEGMAKLHRCFHIPVPPEECVWSEDPKDPLAFQLKGLDVGGLGEAGAGEAS